MDWTNDPPVEGLHLKETASDIYPWGQHRQRRFTRPVFQWQALHPRKLAGVVNHQSAIVRQGMASNPKVVTTFGFARLTQLRKLKRVVIGQGQVSLVSNRNATCQFSNCFNTTALHALRCIFECLQGLSNRHHVFHSQRRASCRAVMGTSQCARRCSSGLLLGRVVHQSQRLIHRCCHVCHLPRRSGLQR